MTNPHPGRELVIVAVPVALLVLFFGYLAATSLSGTVVLLSLVLLAAAASLPRWLLPTISLWLFALLPLGYLVDVPSFVGRFFTPAVVVLLVWLARTAWGPGRQHLVRSLAWVVPFLVLFVALSYHGINKTRSINWVVVLTITVVLTVALLPAVDERTSSTLLQSWFLLSTGLAVVAVVESLVEENPLAPLYYFGQHWSVYRVTTTLGHPLTNGTFFAVSACLAAFAVIRRSTGRALPAVCFVLTALATGLTGSRSGVYALISGLGVGLVFMLLSGRASIANKLVGIVVAVAALLVLPALPAIAGRAASAEGTASSLYRDGVIKLAGKLFLQQPWLGYGPGNSVIATARAGSKLPLENSVLGTLVSAGAIGSAALLCVVVLLLVRVARGGRVDGLAGVSAYVVAGSAFPLWETNPAALVVLGLVLVATRAHPPAAAETVTTARAGGRPVVVRRAASSSPAGSLHA